MMRDRIRIRLATILTVIGILACDQHVPPTATRTPGARPAMDVATGGGCGVGTCVFANTIRPLQAATVEPDSSDLVVPLGEVLLKMQAGDSVALIVTASPDIAANMPSDEIVSAVSSFDTMRVPLTTATTAVTIFRAVASDTVRLRLALSRRLTAMPRGGSLTVTMVYAADSVMTSSTPWVAPIRRFLASPVTCTEVTPGTSSCPGVSAGINPYAPGDHFGADFQSQPRSGASTPITLTFSQAIQSVTITIQDPTFVGNTMTAFRADGSVVGSVPFPGSGVPGVNIPDTETITGGQIVRVLLTPAAGDYVAYSGLSFIAAPAANLEVQCTPSAPVRGTRIDCAVSMTDGSAFTLTRLRSSIGGQSVTDISGSVAVPSVFHWKGFVAAGTDLIVDGMSGSQAVSATTSFTVTSRIGVEPTWTAPTQSASPPDPIPASGMPLLKDDYPGLRPTANGGATAIRGALGSTYHLYPEWSAGVIPSGPNAGVALTLGLAWQANGAPAPGMYISAALFPGDGFYAKQTGGGDHCTVADMDQLRGSVYTHETQHYVGGVQIRHNLHTHETYESLFAIVGARADTSVVNPIFEAVRKSFNTAIQLSDSLVDQNSPPANLPSCRMRF